MATKAFQPTVRKLLVRLLNQYQEHVNAAHSSDEATEIKAEILLKQDGKALLNLEASRTADYVITEDKQDEPKAEDNQDDPIAEDNPTQGKKGTDAGDNEEGDVGHEELEVEDEDMQKEKDEDGGDSEEGGISDQENPPDPDDREWEDTGEDDDGDEEDFEDDSDESRYERDSDYVQDTDASRFIAYTNDRTGPSHEDPEDPEAFLTEQDFALMANDMGYSEREATLRQNLVLPPNKVYNDSDLDNEATLHRALRLLYAARTGEGMLRLKPTIHIKYTQLNNSLGDAAEREMKLIGQDLSKFYLNRPKL